MIYYVLVKLFLTLYLFELSYFFIGKTCLHTFKDINRLTQREREIGAAAIIKVANLFFVELEVNWLRLPTRVWPSALSVPFETVCMSVGFDVLLSPAFL